GRHESLDVRVLEPTVSPACSRAFRGGWVLRHSRLSQADAASSDIAPRRPLRSCRLLAMLRAVSWLEEAYQTWVGIWCARRWFLKAVSLRAPPKSNQRVAG